MSRPAARLPSQDRSAQRRSAIALATIAVIAEHGLAGVTHRLVAQRAGVSLAATTYYYATKLDLVADASRELFADYLGIFDRFAARVERGEAGGVTFKDFMLRPALQAAGGNQRSALAWGEIMLGAGREPALRPVAAGWMESFPPVLERIAAAYGVPDPQATARSANDITVGLLFDILGVGPSEAAVADVLGGASAVEHWTPQVDSLPEPPPPPATDKARATRERILDAALDIMTEEGAAAITLRRVAERAGLTAAAPAYHFATVQALVAAVQDLLFARLRLRYRGDFEEVDLGRMDAERLAAMSAASLAREAGAFANISHAQLHIRLQAAREPRLRRAAWSVIRSQVIAWQQALTVVLGEATPLQALALQAGYVGKLVRALVDDSGIATAEAEMAAEIAAFATGRHWLTAGDRPHEHSKGRP